MIFRGVLKINILKNKRIFIFLKHEKAQKCKEQSDEAPKI